MTQPSLGQRLAQTQAEEKARTVASQRNAARHLSEDDLKRFNQVFSFFDDAKHFFEQAILDQTPTTQLRIQVGRTGPQGSASHMAVYQTLRGWDYDGNELRSLKGGGAFASLWTDFQAWARSQGLVAQWQYAHDGGGMESWWYLRVTPDSAALAGAPAVAVVPGNDVRLSHAYSLHVLGSVLHGYRDATRALGALQGHPVAQAHLSKYKDLIQTVHLLHADLVGD